MLNIHLTITSLFLYPNSHECKFMLKLIAFSQMLECKLFYNWHIFLNCTRKHCISHRNSVSHIYHVRVIYFRSFHMLLFQRESMTPYKIWLTQKTSCWRVSITQATTVQISPQTRHLCVNYTHPELMTTGYLLHLVSRVTTLYRIPT